MKHRIISNLFWKFSEQIMVKVFSLIISVILARLLMPDDYGVIVVVNAIITICSLPVSNGLSNALIQKKNADDSDFSSSFFINILFAIIIYILIYFFSPLIAFFYNVPILSSVLRVSGLSIVVSGFNSIQHAFVSKKMMFKSFFFSTLWGTLISGIVGILLAIKGFGVWALVAQQLINTCIDTLVLWVTVKWRPKLLMSFDNLKELFKYGWKLIISGFLNALSTQLSIYIIGKRYSMERLAYYNQGDKYPNTVMSSIDSSINSVLFPALSEVQDDLSRVRYLGRRSVQISTFIIFPLMLGACACAEPAIRLFFTVKWLPSVPYFRIFCLVYSLWPIHTINLQIIKSLGKSDIFLKLDLIKQTMTIVLVLICVHFDPIMVAYGILIADVISVAINIYPNYKLINYGFREQFADFIKPAFISIIMAVCLYFITFLNLNDIYILALQIGLGIIIYTVLSFIFNRSCITIMSDYLISEKEKNGL